MQRNTISSNISKNIKESKFKKSSQYLIPEFQRRSMQSDTDKNSPTKINISNIDDNNLKI